MALRGRSLTAQNAALLDRRDSAGDLATAGVAPKAWIRRDGVFWLLKDGDTEEVEAELTASQIARCFDVPQVLYEPQDYQGQRVSASRLMTTKAQSIVPMEFVDVYAANVDKTPESIVASRDLYGFHMMNIVDYLVGNVDRHCGNWGFWVDNRTNKLGKLHPLMDFNKAFHAYDSVEGGQVPDRAEEYVPEGCRDHGGEGDRVKPDTGAAGRPAGDVLQKIRRIERSRCEVIP